MTDNDKIDVGYEWKEGKTKNPAGMAAIAAVILILLVLGGTTLWSYNSLIGLSESVRSAKAQIESNIQRKADLLPNLVKTVKAYAKHEEKIFREVTRLRSGAMQNLPKAISGAARYNEALNGIMGRLMAVAENYPDLKSSEQFRQLQAQIEGAENRINVTRMLYNDAVREYNAALGRIPGRFVAPLTGLKPAEYFEADTAAKQAPKLEI